MRHPAALGAALLALVLGCGQSGADDAGSTSGTDWSGAGAGSTSSAGGAGGGGTTGGSGGTGGTGASGGAAPTDLEALLAALRDDRDAALLAQSRASGWPAPVAGGYLVVSADAALTSVAGDYDDWAGSALTADEGFWWSVVPASDGDGYKLGEGASLVADPWSRSYVYDAFGQLSMVVPSITHLERHFEVAGMGLLPRKLRVWVPAEPVTHLLYAHDGQNLFDPSAPWGGWQLDVNLPSAMMVVAIDNTSDRFEEYTHVGDDPFDSGSVGGNGDSYAAFVEQQVRPLVQQTYGEPATVGVIGSSLGGLISLHIAAQNPGDYDFAASLSGTMGWGSIHPSVHNPTMIELYQALGLTSTALYIDSGGGGACVDSDQDGIEDDDPGGLDNYCENKQLEGVLTAAGYQADVDLWHWWEPGAPHNEAAWAARVWRPLGIFAAL
jgi:Putative esterase